LARRRRSRIAINLAAFGEAVWRIAGAIVLEALAFALWNVGTRSPIAFMRSVAAAFRQPRALLAGTLAALIGFIFIAAATVLVLPAIVDVDVEFIPIELGTLLVALVLEQLVGNDLRRLVRGKSS